MVLLLASLALADPSDSSDDQAFGFLLDNYLEEADPARFDDPLLAFAPPADPSETKKGDQLGDELAGAPYTFEEKPEPEKEPWLLIGLGVWVPRLRGPITIQGNSVDLAEVLGLSDPAVTFVPRITARAGRFFFTYEGYWLRYTGVQTLSIDIPIGPGFTIGERIESSINLGFSRLSVGYAVYKTRPVTVTLGLGLGIYRFTGSIAAVETLKESVTFAGWLPVPVLSLDLHGWVNRIFWNVYIAGIGFSFEEVGAESLDIQVAAGYMITPSIALRAGYRATWIRARIQTDILETGNTVRATIEFSLQDGFFFDVVFFF